MSADRLAMRWPATLIGLASGLLLGVLEPLFVLGVGASIYAGPTYLGGLFLLCIAVVVILVPLGALVGAGRAVTARTVVLSGSLALGLLGGNVVATVLHVGFAVPRPHLEIRPTGSGWSSTAT